MKKKYSLLCSKVYAVGPYRTEFYLKSQHSSSYSEIPTLLWNLNVHHLVHIIRPHHRLEYPALKRRHTFNTYFKNILS
jgi:hypothetical protein